MAGIFVAREFRYMLHFVISDTHTYVDIVMIDSNILKLDSIIKFQY